MKFSTYILIILYCVFFVIIKKLTNNPRTDLKIISKKKVI